MSSPDGLTGIKQLPRLDWSSTDNPNHPSKGGADCLLYRKEMSAADMLKYMIGVLQVEFVRDEPTPDLADIQRNTAARNTPKMSFSADKARVNEQGDRVQTNNINANPNGNGTGNWTLQENVR
jgi:hypothetical protein